MIRENNRLIENRTGERGKEILFSFPFLLFGTLICLVIFSVSEGSKKSIQPVGEFLSVTAALAGDSSEAPLQLEDYPTARDPDSKITVVLGTVSGTLKDILRRKRGLGLDLQEEYVFVLPPELFKNGRNFGDVEFLVYYNAFIRGNLFKGGAGLRVVGTPRQLEALKEYLEHTIFGPRWEDERVYPWLSEEERRFFIAMKEHYAIPNKEGAIRPIEDYVQFIPFDPQTATAVVAIGENEIQIQENPQIQLGSPSYTVKRTNGQQLGELSFAYNSPESFRHPVSAQDREALLRAKDEGDFARTLIGTSNGFDPDGDTTSLILWLEGIGIWVDPSHEGLSNMEALGITDQDIPYALLTHIHQDHDGGLLELILRGKKIHLIAPRLVYEEFMKKVELLLQFTSISIDPASLVDWIPFDPGTPLEIALPSSEKAILESWWNIHTIPTIGFSVTYKGVSYGHSGDIQWSYDFIDQLAAKGALTAEQVQEFKNRFFKETGYPQFDYVDFEVGGKPGIGNIHTTPEDMAELLRDQSPETLGRIFFYHQSDARVHGVVDATLVPLRKARMFETTSFLLADDQTRLARALQHLLRNPLVQHHESRFPGFIERFLQVANREIIPEGQRLTLQGHRLRVSSSDGIGKISTEGPFKEGDQDRVYFIVGGTGQAVVYIGDQKVAKLGLAGHFGDWAVVTDKPRTATVKAEDGTLEVYSLTAEEFKSLFGSPETTQAIQWVSENLGLLQEWSQKVSSRIFSDLSNFALGVLAARAEERTITAGQTFIHKGEAGDEFYIVKEGEITVVTGNGEISLGRGQHVGEIAILRNIPRTVDVRARTEVKVLVFDRALLLELLNHFPAIRVGIEAETDRRLAELIRGLLAQLENQQEKNEVIQKFVPSLVELRILLNDYAHLYGQQVVYLFLEALYNAVNDIDSVRAVGFNPETQKNTLNSASLLLQTEELRKLDSNSLDAVILNLLEEQGIGSLPEVALEIYRILKNGATLHILAMNDSAIAPFREAGFRVQVLMAGMYQLSKPTISREQQERLTKLYRTAVKIGIPARVIREAMAADPAAVINNLQKLIENRVDEATEAAKIAKVPEQYLNDSTGLEVELRIHILTAYTLIKELFGFYTEALKHGLPEKDIQGLLELVDPKDPQAHIVLQDLARYFSNQPTAGFAEHLSSIQGNLSSVDDPVAILSIIKTMTSHMGAPSEELQPLLEAQAMALAIGISPRKLVTEGARSPDEELGLIHAEIGRELQLVQREAGIAGVKPSILDRIERGIGDSVQRYHLLVFHTLLKDMQWLKSVDRTDSVRNNIQQDEQNPEAIALFDDLHGFTNGKTPTDANLLTSLGKSKHPAAALAAVSRQMELERAKLFEEIVSDQGLSLADMQERFLRPPFGFRAALPALRRHLTEDPLPEQPVPKAVILTLPESAI